MTSFRSEIVETSGIQTFLHNVKHEQIDLLVQALEMNELMVPPKFIIEASLMGNEYRLELTTEGLQRVFRFYQQDKLQGSFFMPVGESFTHFYLWLEKEIGLT